MSKQYNIARMCHTAKVLAEWVERDDWDTIQRGYSRQVKILRGWTSPTQIDKTLFGSAEREYYLAICAAELVIALSPDPPLVSFLHTLRCMIPDIDRFFSEVFIMTEDTAKRNNRLALVQSAVNLGDVGVDWTKLEGF